MMRYYRNSLTEGKKNTSMSLQDVENEYGGASRIQSTEQSLDNVKKSHNEEEDLDEGGLC